MSRGRPRRAAALHAEWLSREQRQLAHSACARPARPHRILLDDDDSRDASYGPSTSKRRRPNHRRTHRRIRLTPHSPHPSPSPPTPPPPPSPTDFDIWDEDPRDVRHQRTRMTGCYVIAPLYRVPPGYIDERTAKEREEQPQSQSNCFAFPIPSHPPPFRRHLAVPELSHCAPCRLATPPSPLPSPPSPAGFSSAVSSQHRSPFTAIHRWLCSTSHVHRPLEPLLPRPHRARPLRCGRGGPFPPLLPAVHLPHLPLRSGGLSLPPPPPLLRISHHRREDHPTAPPLPPDSLPALHLLHLPHPPLIRLLPLPPLPSPTLHPHPTPHQTPLVQPHPLVAADPSGPLLLPPPPHPPPPAPHHP